MLRRNVLFPPKEPTFAGYELRQTSESARRAVGRHLAPLPAIQAGPRHLAEVGRYEMGADATAMPYHCDSNLKLSEERAVTVAKIFAANKVPARQIYYKGAGDAQPIDTNETPDGRARNRRVEVVELSSEDGIVAFDGAAEANRVDVNKNWFMVKGGVRRIDPRVEMEKVNKANMVGDFGGAAIYVIGAGVLPASLSGAEAPRQGAHSYRDPLTMQSLKAFWMSFFERSHGLLKGFGEPILLSPVE